MEKNLQQLEEEFAFPCAKGGRFFNPHSRGVPRKFRHLFLWFLGYYKDRADFEKAPADFIYPQGNLLPLDATQPTVTWINHSTFLVQMGGAHLLTDPIWSNRCSPFDFIGPLRRHPPGIPFDQLPPIDYVLISHNHYDHLDKKTVKKLHASFPNILWFIPQGLRPWFAKLGVTNCVELYWWQRHEIAGGWEFHFVPAQHYAGRGLFDVNRSLWGGWLVTKGDKTFYFAGDTGYNPIDFQLIGRRFPKIDLSLLPIGAYRPIRFMRPAHICPEEAVQIHQEVGSCLSVGSHWHTFRLSTEPDRQPPFDLFQALLAKGLFPETFRALEPGQTINW